MTSSFQEQSLVRRRIVLLTSHACAYVTILAQVRRWGGERGRRNEAEILREVKKERARSRQSKNPGRELGLKGTGSGQFVLLPPLSSLPPPFQFVGCSSRQINLLPEVYQKYTAT